MVFDVGDMLSGEGVGTHTTVCASVAFKAYMYACVHCVVLCDGLDLLLQLVVHCVVCCSYTVLHGVQLHCTPCSLLFTACY